MAYIGHHGIIIFFFMGNSNHSRGDIQRILNLIIRVSYVKGKILFIRILQAE